MQSSSGCIGSEEVPGRDHPDRAGVVADQEMSHVVLHHEYGRVVDGGIWRAGDHIPIIQVGAGGRVQILTPAMASIRSRSETIPCT